MLHIYLTIELFWNGVYSQSKCHSFTKRTEKYELAWILYLIVTIFTVCCMFSVEVGYDFEM